jgi:uncharacterized protein YjdB
MRKCAMILSVMAIITSIVYVSSSYSQTFPRLLIAAHLQGIGDVTGPDNQWIGTKGESRRLEGIMIEFVNLVPDLALEYMCHLQGIGDVDWMKQGNFCGTRGESRRLEGFAIRLRGNEAGNYDVMYQCHLEGIGDFPVVRNGEFCGTRGQSRRLEALRVWIARR